MCLPVQHFRAPRQLQTLPEQIAELIFTSIANGEYEPGERIREEAVVERFNDLMQSPHDGSTVLVSLNAMVSEIP